MPLAAKGQHHQHCKNRRKTQRVPQRKGCAEQCHGHIEARYLRLTIGFSSSWSKTLSEIDIYKIDSEDPTVYAVTGSEKP